MNSLKLQKDVDVLWTEYKKHSKVIVEEKIFFSCCLSSLMDKAKEQKWNRTKEKFTKVYHIILRDGFYIE